MLPYLQLILVTILFLSYLAELWTGFAVVAHHLNLSVVDRAKQPRQYWFWMAIHTLGWVITFAIWFHSP